MNKKLIGLFILIILTSEILLVSSSSNEENKVNEEVYSAFKGQDYVRVIIKLKEPTQEKGFLIKSVKNVEEVQEEKAKIKEEVLNSLDKEGIKHIFDETIAIEVSENKLNELKNDPNIESIIIDKPIKAFLQNSVLLINATSAWSIQVSGINITGEDETICILDTGIDFSHPALTGKNKTCMIDCYNKACIENCSVNDDNGHGTHVAGIAAASGTINGVAIGANLIGVKVLDSAGGGSSTDLEAGIDWCINNYVSYNISVISMSLGTDCEVYPQYCYNTYCDEEITEQSLALKINNATTHNISVIIATGNNGNSTHISSPACITNATAVAASNKEDSFAIYSNRNNLIDLIAPGTDINSTVPIGSCEFCASSRYNILSGTSMSAPHVAGAFALFRQFFRLQNSRIPTPQEIQDRLNSTGKQIYDSSGTGLTFSRIDIYSAIEAITKSVSLIFESPLNNSFTKQDDNNFTCNSTSKNYQLANISFYLWNSTNNLIYNLTDDITGNNNLSVFNYTFSSEGAYSWDCIAYNNQSYSSSSSNFTINYDITAPNVSLVSSSVSTTTATITWTTNENANSSVNYGTIGDLESITSNSSLATSHSVFLSSLSSSTVYYYNLTSCDAANNCNITGTNSFTTSTPAAVVSSSGGGGGGSSVTATIYVATLEQASLGYTGSLSKNDKIKFSFFDAKSEEHVLTITQLGAGFVDILIQSEPIKLSLGIGQSAKLNLTSADYYDLYVKFDSIKDNKADITIQTIHEEIPKPALITGDSIEGIKEQEGETTKRDIADLKFKITTLQRILYFIVVMFIIIIIFLSFIKKENTREVIKFKKREGYIKEHRKTFKQIKPKKQI